MKFLYKVGDVVRVKSNISRTDKCFTWFHQRYQGQELKITAVDHDDPRFPYRLECGDWWRQTWLERIDKSTLNISSDDLMELLT